MRAKRSLLRGKAEQPESCPHGTLQCFKLCSPLSNPEPNDARCSKRREYPEGRNTSAERLLMPTFNHRLTNCLYPISTDFTQEGKSEVQMRGGNPLNRRMPDAKVASQLGDHAGRQVTCRRIKIDRDKQTHLSPGTSLAAHLH